MSMLKHGMEGIMGDATKIRKRGCSPSSSISSAVQNYRFKRAILVGKKRGGRSTTPVPTWRMVSSRSPSIASRVSAAAEFSPKYPLNQSGNQRAAQQLPPVSARKLAATLWELNEVPSPRTMRWEDLTERRMRGETRRERVGRSVNSGSLPPHLSDPSHSPVSEKQWAAMRHLCDVCLSESERKILRVTFTRCLLKKTCEARPSCDNSLNACLKQISSRFPLGDRKPTT